MEQVEAAAKPRDSWCTVLIVDPVALRLVRLLARSTPATPGQLTAAAALLAFVTAGAFLTGDRTLALAGAVLFLAAYLLDCMDGKLARLTGSRARGVSASSDLMSRARSSVCTSALLIGQYVHTGNPGYLLLGVAAVTTVLLCEITGSHTAGPARIGFLARRRLRTRPVTEVEFAIAVCVVAPLTGAYLPVIGIAIVLLVVCELAGLCMLVRSLRTTG